MHRVMVVSTFMEPDYSLLGSYEPNRKGKAVPVTDREGP
jgi:hypothetical protein